MEHRHGHYLARSREPQSRRNAGPRIAGPRNAGPRNAGPRNAGGPAHRPPGFRWVTNRSESLESSRIHERVVVPGRCDRWSHIPKLLLLLILRLLVFHICASKCRATGLTGRALPAVPYRPCPTGRALPAVPFLTTAPTLTACGNFSAESLRQVQPAAEPTGHDVSLGFRALQASLLAHQRANPLDFENETTRSEPPGCLRGASCQVGATAGRTFRSSCFYWGFALWRPGFSQP
ncbi:hypothetical protein SCOR_17845 [Sulfidibacter corallicola]